MTLVNGNIKNSQNMRTMVVVSDVTFWYDPTQDEVMTKFPTNMRNG